MTTAVKPSVLAELTAATAQIAKLEFHSSDFVAGNVTYSDGRYVLPISCGETRYVAFYGIPPDKNPYGRGLGPHMYLVTADNGERFAAIVRKDDGEIPIVDWEGTV